METNTFTRPIINELLAIKGDKLFIEGQCLIEPLRFSQFFIENTRSIWRPVFLLNPIGTSKKLVLAMDGPVKNFGQSNFLSPDLKTVNFHNTLPLMYIFPLDFFDENCQKKILWGHLPEEGISNHLPNSDEERICRQIEEIGFIQPCVKKVIFTATFDHPDSKAGRFTLLI